MDYTVIPATEEDLDALFQLIYNRCIWFEENQLVGWRAKSYMKAYDRAYFQTQMKKNKLFVAKKDGKTYGVMLLKSEDPPYWEDTCDSYFLHHLATDPAAKGVGKILLQHALEQCKKDGKKYLRLDCFQEGAFLNEYYSQAGFQMVGSGKNGHYRYHLWQYSVDV